MSREDDRARRLLREQAEGVVRGADSTLESGVSEENRSLIHELQVHQVELEMQNEELRRAQRELEVSRDRFFWLFNQAPLGYVTLDGAGIVHQVNQTLADMLGAEIGEIRNKPFSVWIAPRDRDVFLARFKAIFRHPQSKRIEAGLLSRRRKNMHASLEGRQLEFPLPLAQDRASEQLLLLTVRDITERRKAQDALVASERLLKMILESTADGIVCVDEDGRTMHANRKFFEMWRLPADGSAQTVHEPWLLRAVDQLEDPEGYEHSVQVLSESREERSGSFSFKDGRVFDWYSRPLAPDASISGRLWSFRDVTAMRKLEVQYRQAQKMEAVGQLAGGVAHDFNNLLQVITGYIELALMGLEEDHAVRPRLDRVRGAALRATALVRQLLAFSRRQSMHMQRLDLNEVIGNVLAMLRRVLGEHIEIAFNPGEGVGWIQGDPGQLELVLMNLAVNSRDAMPEGGRITIETRKILTDESFREAHSWALAAEYVIMTVEDTGTGIPEELREYIFEPFFTTKGIGKGTGLGLATAYGIVKQHEGAILLGSAEGPGAVFHVYLPVVEGIGDASGRLHMEEPFGSGDSMGAERGAGTILVAEDDQLVREMAVQILESAGYRTIVARDGLEAREKFLHHADQVDLAFLDVVMPKGSGRAVGEYIRSLNPRVPILLCTGYEFSILGQSMGLGEHFEVIRKPYTPEGLLRSIREILRSPPVAFDRKL